MKRGPLIIGLTGSIGMGKTTVARMFERCGVPVLDSDAVVHRLLAKGGAAVAQVASLFPGAHQEEAIHRPTLGASIFGHPERLALLESVLHPLVRAEQERFTARARLRRRGAVLLDIPLLFETAGETRCDTTVVVSAPPAVQRARVLARPGMTEERFQRILARQMPDSAKRYRADFVIPTGLGRQVSLMAVHRVLRALRIDSAASAR